MSEKQPTPHLPDSSDGDDIDDNKQAKSLSQSATPTEMSSFRWEELTGKTDLPTYFDYKVLWRHLSWYQLPQSDQVNTTPSNFSLPVNALDWTSWVEINEKAYIGGGGFGDAYMGRWYNIPLGIGAMPEVVVKVFRLAPIGKSVEKRKKWIQREILVWSNLQHENIVPFVGICYPRGPECPVVISPWMKDRDIMLYLEEHPQVNRKSMLPGIALGIEYLHTFSPEIVHGDIKGANILVNSRGQPCLIDFGLSRMVSDETFWRTSSSHVQGSTRWMAPELIVGIESRVTTEGDIYAFAMTCLEVTTGHAPFSKYKQDVTVATIVMNGETPEKPDNIDVESYLWTMWNQCWSHESSKRPSATETARRLVVANFFDSLNITSLKSIKGFKIIYFLIAGNCAAALNALLSIHPSIPNDVQTAWRHQPPTTYTRSL